MTKRFEKFTAVDAIDFDVWPGETFGFLGPNGAGKTSTMKMIGCTSPATSGELRVMGMDPATRASQIKARLGVVPQLDNLDIELTVRENLLMYAQAIREKGEFYMPLGEGKVSWIDARDIAAVAVQALTKPGHENQAYPVTGPQALSGAEVAAALSAVAGPDARVTFVDSNVRAVEVSRINAEANGLTDFRVHATATMSGLPEADFDVVLANPPYHARLDIARRFVEGSLPLMKPGGRFFVVTKQPNGVVPMVEETFGNVAAYERRGYTVILGRAPFRSAE